jgi:hypothetical protein
MELQLGAGAGFETAVVFMEAVIKELGYKNGSSGEAQYGAQKQGDLAKIIGEWAKLPADIKSALLALVCAANRATGYPEAPRRFTAEYRSGGTASLGVQDRWWLTSPFGTTRPIRATTASSGGVNAQSSANLESVQVLRGKEVNIETDVCH